MAAGRGRAKKAPTGVRGGADEVLENLVQQFADPFAFVRELVQNALDAGSLRIDVEATITEASGKLLLGIAVVDTGSGMTAEIIDEYLVTLFRSTKEDDATKIGKFGIGFVSVFALQPDLVVVDTARGGERWRVLFHPDRRYERVARTDPMEGTRVEVLKYVDRATAEEYARKALAAAERWCGHARAELYWKGADGARRRLDRPLQLGDDEAWPAIEHRADDLHVVVGLARDEGRARFYNQGLLLHERAEPAVSFKLDSPHLEHTLTRDNVLMDAHYLELMAALQSVITDKLGTRVLDELEALALKLCPAPDFEPDEALVAEHLRLLSWVVFHPWVPARGIERKLMPTFAGPVTLAALRGGGLEAPARILAGEWLSARHDSHVVQLLGRAGVHVVPQALATAWEPLARALGRAEVPLRDVNTVFLAPLPVETMPPVLELAARFLHEAGLKRRDLRLGRLDYTGSRAVELPYVLQAEPFALAAFDKPEVGRFSEACLVLNIAAPFVREVLQLAERAPVPAAVLLARVLAVRERGGETGVQALVRAAAEALP